LNECTILEAILMENVEVSVAESCAPTKKACKNCSCGRAELEEKELETKLTAAQISNPKSACGSVSGQPALQRFQFDPSKAFSYIGLKMLCSM
jgi:hypothetical protein